MPIQYYNYYIFLGFCRLCPLLLRRNELAVTVYDVLLLRYKENFVGISSASFSFFWKYFLFQSVPQDKFGTLSWTALFVSIIVARYVIMPFFLNSWKSAVKDSSLWLYMICFLCRWVRFLWKSNAKFKKRIHVQLFLPCFLFF